MPVAAFRGRKDRVEYVVVRRTVTEDERDVEEVDRRYEPTETVDQILSPANERRDHAFDHDDDDSDDDDDRPDFTPTPVPVTITFPQAQATGALADNDPTETVVVQFTPNPPPPPPHRPNPNKGGISQTTEHLLIAAGSIGATIIVVMVLLAVHTMRKRGFTLAEAVKHGRYQVTRRGPPPPPKGTAQDKQAFDDSYGSIRSNTVSPPQPAVARSGSFSSQRPLMAPQRNQSFRTERSVSPQTVPQSFLMDSSPRRNNTITSHRRNSETPSSPVLPLQTQRESESTHNTRSLSEGSELQFPEPPTQRTLSPLPPPPTFKQFLYNRPSQSGQPRLGPMISRFSWTNSNAPQTPRHEFSRDTNSHTVMRDSYMTQRSSVPRFRTVDSWVQQQSNRIEEQKLKDQFRLTSTSTIYSADEENPSIPEVPEVPRHFSKMGEAGPSNVTASRALTSNPVTPPPQLPIGLPGKNVKHERHDTQMTVETAPIFRQHPGTEVRFSTRSTVPSEILNGKMMPNVLS